MHRAISVALFEEQVAGLTDELLALRGWRVFERAFPILDVGFEAPDRQTMRVRLACDDWNDLPPSITLHDSVGTPLATPPTGPTGVFNPSAHPQTGRPFICMVGSREYHTHSSHIADSWENYRDRSGYTLPEILSQIWSAWQKSRP